MPACCRCVTAAQRPRRTYADERAQRAEPHFGVVVGQQLFEQRQRGEAGIIACRLCGRSDTLRNNTGFTAMSARSCVITGSWEGAHPAAPCVSAIARSPTWASATRCSVVELVNAFRIIPSRGLAASETCSARGGKSWVGPLLSRRPVAQIVPMAQHIPLSRIEPWPGGPLQVGGSTLPAARSIRPHDLYRSLGTKINSVSKRVRVMQQLDGDSIDGDPCAAARARAQLHAAARVGRCLQRQQAARASCVWQHTAR